jgi:hypothetical protein
MASDWPGRTSAASASSETMSVIRRLPGSIVAIQCSSVGGTG